MSRFLVLDSGPLGLITRPDAPSYRATGAGQRRLHARYVALGGKGGTRAEYWSGEKSDRKARLNEDPTFLTALEAMLNVLPPALPSSKKKPDANLSGAANDFQALERLRKLAFAETVPAPKMAVQEVLELVGEGDDEER